MKNEGNRAKQKCIRHTLRVDYEFNISDFNEPGKPFGPDELYAAIDRRAIQILDDATIAAMKEKRERDRQRDEEARRAEAAANGEPVDDGSDWKKALEEWNKTK